MPGCTVDPTASPQFNILRERWRRDHPRIDRDLSDAFESISKDILSKHARRVQAGPVVEVYKYRQNSSDTHRGARYGWRIIALYHKEKGVLYPIIVYPKTAWEDAGNDAIVGAVKEIRVILDLCISPGCDGTMRAAEPVERTQDGEAVFLKTRCAKCGAVNWKLEPA